MNVKLLCFFLIVMSLGSCKKNSPATPESDKMITDTIKDQKDIRNIGEILLPDSKKMVEGWNEYMQLDELLTKFYSISPNEALNLSNELSTITQQLKDSVTIERFKQPDVGIRMNVLYNHALRLNDMASISSIQSDEVKNEIQDILDAFSALNAKINNITKQEKLEKELEIIPIQ